MGIKDFYKTMKKRYSGAFQKEYYGSYDYVYIDINYALHLSSYGGKTINEIYDRLSKFIINVCVELIPRKRLVLASDGTAPLSKLLLQRKRRSGMLKTYDEENEVSSLLFTTGTNFMTDIYKNIKDKIKILEKIYSIDIEYIDNCHDEAELKLKRSLENYVNNDDNSSHIFVSNDADVVVMLTTVEKYKNIFIYLRSNGEILSIAKLIELHIEEVGCSLTPALDFSGIHIFMGNDYLPKLNFLTYTNLYDAYRLALSKDNTGIFSDGKLNKSFLINFLKSIVSLLKKQYINKINLEKYNSESYDNYMDGYIWCFYTYKNSKCDRYNYMYEATLNPHPLELLINLTVSKEELCYKNEVSEPVNYDLYGILLLPYSSKKLIDKKYHEFMEFEETSDVLYQDELCKKCSDLSKKIQNVDNDKEKNEYLSLIKNHRKNHAPINICDINNIQNNFIKFTNI